MSEKLQRIRSAAPWRKASLPTEAEIVKQAQREAETIIHSNLTVSSSRELNLWVRERAEDEGITVSSWLRKLIEKEKASRIK